MFIFIFILHIAFVLFSFFYVYLLFYFATDEPGVCGLWWLSWGSGAACLANPGPISSNITLMTSQGSDTVTFIFKCNSSNMIKSLRLLKMA